MKYARLLSVAAIAIWSPAAAANDLLVLGYLENAQVGPTDLQMRAKLDTGADTSSLGYNRIHHFEKDGAKWVRVQARNVEGKIAVVERRIVRISTVKRHGAPSVDRPVVLIGLCVGNIYRITEVSLADRSDFSVPLLIGRSFLAGTAIVDSSRTYTTRPNCNKGQAQ
tara:strand:- start:14575 stop:15075 length:501 start_codon:yes stop_codon:yes gene_type:complete